MIRRILNRSMPNFVHVVLILIIVSCNGSKPSAYMAPEGKQVVDIADLLQTGHTRFQEVLDQDEVLTDVWLARREKIVMVLIDIEWEDGEREQAIQSGIMVKNGHLIVTAGHGFVIEDGKILEINVQTTAGKKTQVELISLRYDKEQVPVEDWAILQPFQSLHYPEIEILPATNDRKRLMVLGFPATMGLNKKDRVVHVLEKGTGVAYPLGVICSHHVLDRHTLSPEAGAIPLRGISGAPVFSRSGELIGLFSSISRRRNIQGWHYIFGMANVPWDVLDQLIPN